MLYKEFDFSFHRTNFYGQYWKTDTVNAVILLVHGMGEHSSRYADFVVPQLLQNGFAVIAFDQFGHGKTSGKRGHNPGYAYLLESIRLVVQKAKELFKQAPLFLYGHSMGGNLVINYADQFPQHIEGVIATSPLLRLAFDPPQWKLTAGKIIGSLLPSFTMHSGLEIEAISRIQEEVEKYKSDPLIHDKISTNYSIAILEAGESMLENDLKLEAPVLLLHGTGDRITSYKASEELAKKNNMVTLKLFQGGYHELHNDLCREEFIQTIINWLLQKLHIQKS